VFEMGARTWVHDRRLAPSRTKHIAAAAAT
jgi:hypothetical protein